MFRELARISASTINGALDDENTNLPTPESRAAINRLSVPEMLTASDVIGSRTDPDGNVGGEVEDRLDAAAGVPASHGVADITFLEVDLALDAGESGKLGRWTDIQDAYFRPGVNQPFTDAIQ